MSADGKCHALDIKPGDSCAHRLISRPRLISLPSPEPVQRPRELRPQTRFSTHQTDSRLALGVLAASVAGALGLSPALAPWLLVPLHTSRVASPTATRGGGPDAARADRADGLCSSVPLDPAASTQNNSSPGGARSCWIRGAGEPMLPLSGRRLSSRLFTALKRSGNGPVVSSTSHRVTAWRLSPRLMRSFSDAGEHSVRTAAVLIGRPASGSHYPRSEHECAALQRSFLEGASGVNQPDGETAAAAATAGGALGPARALAGGPRRVDGDQLLVVFPAFTSRARNTSDRRLRPPWEAPPWRHSDPDCPVFLRRNARLSPLQNALSDLESPSEREGADAPLSPAARGCRLLQCRETSSALPSVEFSTPSAGLHLNCCLLLSS